MIVCTRGARTQDVEIIGDLDRQLVESSEISSRPEAVGGQAQIENGFRLLERQTCGAVFREPMTRIVDQVISGVISPDGQSRAGRQLARLRRIGGRPDDVDHLVDIHDRDGQTNQDVTPVSRLVQVELGAQRLLREVKAWAWALAHLLRPSVIQGQHVDPERGLQRREAIELVQHHLGRRVAFQLDHNPDTVAVGFVAQIGDAFDLLLADQGGDLLHHGGLVHLVGNFRDHDAAAVLAHRSTWCLERIQPCRGREVYGRGCRSSVDDAAGREVRSATWVMSSSSPMFRIPSMAMQALMISPQVVRRDIGGHAHGDTRAAVDEQVGEGGRKHLTVPAGRNRNWAAQVDGVLLEVLEHHFREAYHARFRITHGGGRIPVDGTEIAVAVDSG